MTRKTWLLLAALVVFIALGGAIWYWPADTSPPSLTQAPAARVDALSWDELRAGIDGMGPGEIRAHGVRLFQEGDPDKAFVLFKTAAKRGDGWSALALGEMYDPATFAAADFTSKRTAFSKPNPRKALQWYEQALANGEAQAEAPRDRLIAHLRTAAAAGDAAAQKILQRRR
jgi:TPR repeat protein